MIRRLYDWTLSLAAGPRAPTALGSVSFVESSFFPIPPDILLIPMVIARREKAWWYAFLCTLTSVVGGVFGYFIGMFLFEQVAQPVLAFYGKLHYVEEFRHIFAEWGWWFVFIAGVTPFPYKVITIASGAAGLSLPIFILASIVSGGSGSSLWPGSCISSARPSRTLSRNASVLCSPCSWCFWSAVLPR